MSTTEKPESAAAETVSGTGTIDNDLETRRLRNEQREKNLKLIERWVLGLKIDWEGFHDRHSHCVDIPCNGTTSKAKRVLARMGLDKKAIEICLLYFAEIGGAIVKLHSTLT